MQTRFTPPTVAGDHIDLTHCANEPAPGAPSISAETLCIIRAEQVRQAVLRHGLDSKPEQGYTHGRGST